MNMAWQFQLYLVLLGSAVVIAVLVALVCWRRRGAPGAQAFALLMVAVAWWAALRALEGGAQTYEVKLTFGKMTYLGIASVAPLWLMAAVTYCGFDRWLTRRRLILLWIIPLITIGLALTNDWHGWLWSSVLPASAATNGNLFYDRGWWWYVALLFNYVALLAGSVLLVRQALLMGRGMRRQAVLLIVAVAIPWTANILNLLRIYLVPGFDLTPFALALTGAIMALGVFRFHLFDLMPRVHSAIIDDLRDAILVLDDQRRILDMNRAALRLAGLATAPIGQSIDRVLPQWSQQFAHLRDVNEIETEISLPQSAGEPRAMELQIAPLRDRSGTIRGKIVTARDMTDRRRADAQLRQLQRAVEQSPVSVVITDTAGSIEYVNPQFTQLTGYALAEAIGQNPRILKTGHTPPEVYADLWQTLAAGREWHGEFLNRKKNGEVYWEDAHMGPVADADGRVTHYVAVKEDITARKRTEDELQQSRARLKAIFDSAFVGITLADRAGRYIQVNQRWSAMCGYPIEQLYQLGPLDLTHPDDRAVNAEKMRQLVEGAIDSYEIEKRYLRPDGSLFWGALSATAIRTAEGDFEASLGIISDVTERHRIEDALRASEEKFNKAFRSSPVALSISDSVTRHYQEVNDAFVRLSGYTREELVGHTARDLHLWADLQEREGVLQLMTQRGFVRGREVRFQSRSGEIRVVLISLEMVELKGVPCLLTTLQDITERKAVEATLQERAAELRGVIDASRDGIVMIALDGRLSVINAVALRLLNLIGRPSDWRGQSAAALLSTLRRTAPEAARASVAEIRQLRRMDDQQPRQREVVILGRTLLWQTLPVWGGETLMGWLLGLRDLTEERAIEQMREDMRHTMVHDLRNPLTGIATSLDVLVDEPEILQPHQLQLLQIARRNSQRMINLVNEILDVGRLESGQMPLNQQTWPLIDLIEDALQVQYVLAQDKRITLDNRVPHDLPLVHADESLIRRVVQNLVGNAVKFTPVGGRVTVVVELTTMISAQPIVLVSVHDTGPGIPPEIQSRLFQKFVTGSQKGRGSGLGLAFCKLAVEAHGQQIWVDSLPGQGTVFTFTVATAVEAVSGR
jgi:PAS domain S-box-containing protein